MPLWKHWALGLGKLQGWGWRFKQVASETSGLKQVACRSTGLQDLRNILHQKTRASVSIF